MKLRSDTFIKTERLWLRQIDETDAEAIVRLRSEENVYKFFLNPVKITVDQHTMWYKDTYVHDDYRIDWIAVDDHNGSFIGVYGAKRVENVVEVSYITDPSHENQGYAAEAVKAIIEWSKKYWNIFVFVANVHCDNKESISFASKLGFSAIRKWGDFITMNIDLRSCPDV